MKAKYFPAKIQSKHAEAFFFFFLRDHQNSSEHRDFLPHHGVSTLTYSDEVHQSVVEVGAFGQEEAAPRTEVMEEEQILFLQDDKQFVLNTIQKRAAHDKPVEDNAMTQQWNMVFTRL